MKNLLSLIENKIRQIKFYVISLVKTLFSQNFCQKREIVNFHTMIHLLMIHSSDTSSTNSTMVCSWRSVHFTPKTFKWKCTYFRIFAFCDKLRQVNYLVHIVQSSSGGCNALVSSLDLECKSLKSIRLLGKGTMPGSEKTALEWDVKSRIMMTLKTTIWNSPQYDSGIVVMTIHRTTT